MLSKIHRFITYLILASFLSWMPGVGDALHLISQAHAVQQDHVSPDYGDEDDDEDDCDCAEDDDWDDDYDYDENEGEDIEEDLYLPPGYQDPRNDGYRIGIPEERPRYEEEADRPGYFKDKIDATSGKTTIDPPVVHIPGPGRQVLRLENFYSSQASFKGPFGAGGSQTFNEKLTLHADGSRTTLEGDSGRHRYVETTTATWYRMASKNDAKAFLEQLQNGTWQETYRDQEVHTFGADGLLTQIKGPDGNVLSTTRDANGNITSVTDAANRAVTITYKTGTSQIEKITDPAGRFWNYTYDAFENMTQVTDPAGNITSFAYDNVHHVTGMTDPNSGVTNYEYEPTTATNIPEKVKVLARVDALGFRRSYQYFQSSTVVTDALGRKWVWEYNTYGQRTTTIDPLGNKAQYIWDGDRNPALVIDPLGRATKFKYDSHGNLLKIKDALGNVWSFTHDARSNRLSETDPLGHTTSLEYDAKDNLIKTTDPLGKITQFGYDAQSNLTSRMDKNGNVTTFAYDASGNVTSITDPLGNVTSFQYDTVGNRTRITDALGNITNFAYDSLNRLTQITFPDNTTIVNTYAGLDLTSVKDQKGNITTYEYDLLHRLTKTTDAKGNITTNDFTPVGKMASVTDARGNRTDYTYDAADRLIKAEAPAVGGVRPTTEYTYDAVGNRLTTKDPKGQVTTFTYDALNRLTRVDYADGRNVQYTYNADGLRTVMVDSIGVTTWEYDANHQQTKAVFPGGRAVGYGYDPVGNLTLLTDPLQGSATYQYDARNFPVSVKDPEGATHTWEYDALGRRTKQTLSNGIVENTTYNNMSRITRVEHKKSDLSILASYDYTYDLNGNRTQMTENDGSVTTWTYDALSQLLTDKKVSGAQTIYDNTYTYDAMGNRLTWLNKDAVTTNYTYDSNNRILTAGGTTYSHDLNGSLILKTEGTQISSYTYNAANRLITAVLPSGTSHQYQYYGSGQRAKRIDSEGETVYVYNNHNLLVEYDGQGNMKARYVMGLGIDEPLKMVRGSVTAFYHTDALGSVRKMTDPGQALLNEYSYDAFGNVTSQTIAVQNPFTFTSREKDPSGLMFYRSRYYDSLIGRFTQRDLLAGNLTTPLTFNRYLYTANNPVRFRDPLGLQQPSTGTAGPYDPPPGSYEGPASGGTDLRQGSDRERIERDIERAEAAEQRLKELEEARMEKKAWWEELKEKLKELWDNFQACLSEKEEQE